ncbi:hypothetical protein EDD58_1188 [Hazenella coriacea]|uniref:Uncharacterized protein n=1 Tax=Hazenella coriacea TaxID=1179467 RepID=A0A4V2UUP5_9BACL|nr:hypothetical protein EDD58_1188 [Hazenella coriacea]
MSKKGKLTTYSFFIIYILLWGYVYYFQNVNWVEESMIPFALATVYYWLLYFREKDVEIKGFWFESAIVLSLLSLFHLLVFLWT